MQLSDELQKAYSETHYHVNTEPPFFMIPGSPSPDLLELHRKSNATSSAFLTAWNPYSEKASDAENTERNKTLREMISESGFDCIPGLGEHPTSPWQGEESFLVLGIDYDTACAIGKRFNQHAILFAGAEAVAELVVLT